MRRLAAAASVLLAAVAAALWFAPRLLDEAVLRERLAALATERLGRPVTLNGPIALQLLPEPRLEAAAVAIGAGEDSLAATARGLRLTLDVAALLRGRLEPRELVIVGAELRLPWPPAALQDLRPPPWLAAFEARLEDSRVTVGEVVLEQVAMRLASHGGSAALEAAGQFAWRGRPVRFAGRLGRAGADGAAPLDLNLTAAGGQFSINGILDAEGGFEGDLAAVGGDLAAFLPAPPGAFEARGRLTADADLLAIDPLEVRLDRQAARGAASLRLASQPRLELALAAGAIDVDAWVASLRQGARPPLALSLDLSAESARLGGLPVRQLRGAVEFRADRLAISDASALLPGDTRVEAAGATAGARLELGVSVATGDLRVLLGALGTPVPADPALLRRAEGRFRLAIEGGQATVTDLEARVDEMRVVGGGAWRTTPRPLLGLGLTVDRLVLDRLLPDRLPTSLSGLPALDLNLRLAADRVMLRGIAVERAALDAGLEAGRFTLRRIGFRLGGLDVTAAGVAELAAEPPRLTELTLEASGRPGLALTALLPAAARPFLPVDEPVLLRAQAAGPPEAIAARLETEFGAFRLEGTGTLDTLAGRAGGTATLRHPGAARALAPLLGPGAAEWLGEGSLAVIGVLSTGAGGIVADHLDLVAGGLRGQGRLALLLNGPRPLLSGRFAAERLPLPPLPSGGAGFAATAGAWGDLDGLDAELALTAERAALPDLPGLEAASATLRLGQGTLAVEGLRGRLAGGAATAELSVGPGEAGPAVTLRATLEDAALTGPLSGLPFDLVAGRIGGAVNLMATGRSLDALRATLAGEVRLWARDGVLAGLDLAAAAVAAGRTALPAAEAGLRDALGSGATGFERLALDARVAEGRAALTGEIGIGEAAAATLGGTVDLGRRALQLRFALPRIGEMSATAGPPAPQGDAPPSPHGEAPAIALRVIGPWAAPRRLPELAPYLRWRAAQP